MAGNWFFGGISLIKPFQLQGCIMKFQSKYNALLISIMAVCLHCTAAEANSAGASKSDMAFTEAMTQFKQGQWSGAYGRFAALADHGHPEAARIALVMLRNGETMYGSKWGASQPQIDKWMKLAGQRMKPLQSVSGD
jgi:hypothetical protein